MNRKRLYENIMNDLRRAFKRSLNEDILDDIDINDFEEDDVTSKINKQNQEMVNQIADGAVRQMIDEKKKLPEYIYNSVAVWKPKDSKELKDVIKGAIKVYGKKVNLNWIDVSEITDMRNMFFRSDFNGDISQWDVSNVTDMSWMFQQSKFNSDISQWNVSNVNNMCWMFYYSEFNGDISDWDVSNVTNMSRMFVRTKFNGDISKWNVSNVTNMCQMFINSKFNGNISKWDVSNVIKMGSMFKDCPLEENPPKWYK